MINLGSQNLKSIDLNKKNPNKNMEEKPKKKSKKEMTNAEKYAYTFIDTPFYKKVTSNYFLYAELFLALTFFTLLIQFFVAKQIY